METNHAKDVSRKKHKGKGRHRGAQTFRRGRALDFRERLYIKRDTLKKQLEASEYKEIRQIIIGELKAVELIIEEFTKQFELHELENVSDRKEEDPAGE
ncbi:2-keto-3-deoxygluconate kinase [Gracilibacillus oryzae]|uniref:2-keto-3-deoxygluconate kinase n=2 Tax=Gracilibacillus oryzae TaxID=1672701 RepID=A0A7C8L6I0_9BACI|nr:2-keto-3-deoxygluconate kinase [Gracilibacillus oryzae]